MSWTQVGSNIIGEAAGDESGISVSINNAGNIIAIGAHKNDGNGADAGSVRVYQLISGSWVQIGSDIDGEAAGDFSGLSVDLNGAGNRLVVGAWFNDGNSNVISRGSVRVYDWNGTNWVQVGSDLDGEGDGDRFGNSVSINDTGDIIAIGGPNNDAGGAGSDNRGHVRVFQWNGTVWTQLGSDINGEAAGDNSGWSLSLNSAGNRLAIGARNNDAGNVNTDNRGHVRVYEWNGTSWTQLGSDIDGEAAGDLSGYSVSLNSVGNRVAVGAYNNDAGNVSTDNRGHVRIYEWNGTTWSQMGSDIDGETAGDLSGFSVSLNSVGDIVAIGAVLNDGTTGNNADNRGSVRVYQWNGSSWSLLGTDLDGENSGDQYGYSVSLNSSGNTLIIGGPLFDSGGAETGYAKVFSYPLSEPEGPQPELPCLTENNNILTTNGYVNILNLKVGDVVITSDNRQSKILKINTRTVNCNYHTYPYIIHKYSISDSYPLEDCYLSPGHLILYDDKWIHPKLSGLFNKDMTNNTVTYYHIQLENYKTDHLVINGGTKVESYSNGDRREYRNRLNNLYNK